MREDSRRSTWLNSLALDFVPISSALSFRWKQSAKDQRPIFLNTGEALRAHDRILGEQNSITLVFVHFLQTYQSVFPIRTGSGEALHSSPSHDVLLVLLLMDKSVRIDMVRRQTLHCLLRVTRLSSPYGTS